MMLGKEDALFMPSGTQSNLTALMSHCQRGDEYIVGQHAHTYRYEAGGGAVLGSIQPQPIIHQADGTLALTDIEACIKPDDPHFARTRLLCLENTFGGRVLTMDYLRRATGLARHRGLVTHLDGARMFNAAVAMSQLEGGDPRTHARAMAELFDSVSVCFSKGLGAPVGSALVGDRPLIERARRIRKMLGGGMRQAGVLAAAALHALDHHVERLAEDHANARRLAAGFEGLAGVSVEAPETNMVFVDVASERAQGLLASLAEQGVLATGLYRLRLVTHLDVTPVDIDRAAAIFRAALRGTMTA
jgi:threonine aldolase